MSKRIRQDNGYYLAVVRLTEMSLTISSLGIEAIYAKSRAGIDLIRCGVYYEAIKRYYYDCKVLSSFKCAYIMDIYSQAIRD